MHETSGEKTLFNFLLIGEVSDTVQYSRTGEKIFVLRFGTVNKVPILNLVLDLQSFKFFSSHQ
jgi:hypothetical protein